MTDHVAYSLDTNLNLAVEAPDVVIEKAYSDAYEQTGRRDAVLYVDRTQAMGRLIFLLEDFKATRGTAANDPRAATMVRVLDAVNAGVSSDEPGADLTIRISVGSPGDGSGQDRRAMYAEAPWPFRDPHAAMAAATVAMRRMALAFGYLKPNIADSAYAHIGETGAEFQALDIAASDLSTAGELDPEYDDRAYLYGHNIYNDQLALTCLYGLVAAVQTNRSARSPKE